MKRADWDAQRHNSRFLLCLFLLFECEENALCPTRHFLPLEEEERVAVAWALVDEVVPELGAAEVGALELALTLTLTLLEAASLPPDEFCVACAGGALVVVGNEVPDGVAITASVAVSFPRVVKPVCTPSELNVGI